MNPIQKQNLILMLLMTALVALSLLAGGLILFNMDSAPIAGSGGIPAERITETYGAEQFHIQLTAQAQQAIATPYPEVYP